MKGEIFMKIVYIAPKKSSHEESLTLQQKRAMASISTLMTVCMINVNTYANQLNTAGLKAKIAVTGNQLIDVVQLFIYWITLLCALIDIAKTVKKQDIAGVVAIVLKYGAMMGAGYAMPWLWDIIKDIFS